MASIIEAKLFIMISTVDFIRVTKMTDMNGFATTIIIAIVVIVVTVIIKVVTTVTAFIIVTVMLMMIIITTIIEMGVMFIVVKAFVLIGIRERMDWMYVFYRILLMKRLNYS